MPLLARPATIPLAARIPSPQPWSPSHAPAASLGAPFANLANITSALLPKLSPLLPPGLQSYLDTSVDTVSTALANSSSYIESATGIPPSALYGTVAGVVILGAAARTVAGRKSGAPPDANQSASAAADAASKVSRNKKRKAAKKPKKESEEEAAAAPPPPPVKEDTSASKKGKGKNKKNSKKNSKNQKGTEETEDMRRYGWSNGQHVLSPLSSTLGQGGVPEITDDDYDYITSDDLRRNANNHYGQRSPSSVAGGSDFRTASTSGYDNDNDDEITGIPREDVLLLRRGSTVEKEYFPAYSIGDGKLNVRDVRERVEMIYKLEEDEMLEVRLRYKGKLLDDDLQPICRYGVKNNSELTISLPGDEPDIAYAQQRAPKSPVSSSYNTKPSKTSRPRSPKASGGPSASTGNLDVPSRGRGDRQGGSASRAHSAASGASGVSGVSGASGASGASAAIANIAKMAPPKAVPGSPMDKLNNIAQHYADKLQPLCDEFLAHPPSDSKRRSDEYRKISETTFQHVLLKLDEVDTGGDDAVRARRKALVNEVQETLRQMDLKVKDK
ncbi:bag domain-containing protein [Ophiostoma piceae UAMH 11346]|uniref:Bag domain-containing protein n=1 Tax=Ophiostoma piceae (strain UAMH 11346) TaxID=1262450 RepID=S3CPV2_OPHP1|nr:bag domain-containing protein [Ophiostoma piceae UAMH 11346]